MNESPSHACEAEDDEAGEQHALASEAVRQTSRRQEERREGQVVGVNDPLQLRCRGA